jgi:hypothetical protein
MGNITIKAIVIGCLVDWGGTALFGLLFGMIAVSTETMRGMRAEQAVDALLQWSSSTPGMLFSMLFGLGFTCLGGYTAARTSPRETLINSAFVGSVGIITGLPFMAHSPIPGTIVSIVLSIPVAILGGFFHTKKIIF